MKFLRHYRPSVIKSVANLADFLDRYFARAAAVGLSRETADRILREEMDKSIASPRITTGDAIASAGRRLLVEADAIER